MMLNMVLHVPVDERADGIDVDSARVETMVMYVLSKPRMLEHAHQNEVPRAQRVRQEDVRHRKWATKIDRSNDCESVDA